MAIGFFYSLVTVNIPKGRLLTLAKTDIIAWIEPGPAPHENQNRLNAQPLSNVDKVQNTLNLDGTGVSIGVWEFGGTVYASHGDLTPRVTIKPLQLPLRTDHATLVAGTLGASGVNVPNAEGMAPNATLVSWDSFFDTMEMYFAATSSAPIQISNHSYGYLIGWNYGGTEFINNQYLFGLYNNTSAALDTIIFHTGLTVIKSAGNERDNASSAPIAGQPADCYQGGLGVAADCLGPYATAKNIITVGAMDKATAITAFSSYGPTDDGRIKPDLMAQGANMLSLTAGSSGNNTPSGIASGTSLAAPVVAGIAALVLQEAKNRNYPMTPAAMKALLVQTAQDVQGIGQSQPGPDYATGWGIVDAEAAVNLLRRNGLIQGRLTATSMGNGWSRTFYVSPGQPEIHVTLAWDDPPGTPGGQILVNDLNLRLIAPNSNAFTPWILNPLNPSAAAIRNGGNESTNNVEQVSVQNPMAGMWKVLVYADAGNLPQAPQRFAVAGDISSDESLPCSTWDGDLATCDLHGYKDPDPTNDTQDCAYYRCSDKCRPRGTPNCQAGCIGDCGVGDILETLACDRWDGDLATCDLHGYKDPDPTNDTQDCAYYRCSDKCRPRGTSNCQAGCTGDC